MRAAYTGVGEYGTFAIEGDDLESLPRTLAAYLLGVKAPGLLFTLLSTSLIIVVLPLPGSPLRRQAFFITNQLYIKYRLYVHRDGYLYRKRSNSQSG